MTGTLARLESDLCPMPEHPHLEKFGYCRECDAEWTYERNHLGMLTVDVYDKTGSDLEFSSRRSEWLGIIETAYMPTAILTRMLDKARRDVAKLSA